MFSCLWNNLTCLHLEKVGKENRGINTRSRIQCIKKCRYMGKKEHNKNHMERHIKQIHYIDLKKTLVSSRCSCWVSNVYTRHVTRCSCWVSNVYTRHVIHSKHGKVWQRKRYKTNYEWGKKSDLIWALLLMACLCYFVEIK